MWVNGAAISLFCCGYLVIIPVQPTDGSVNMFFDSFTLHDSCRLGDLTLGLDYLFSITIILTTAGKFEH